MRKLSARENFFSKNLGMSGLLLVVLAFCGASHASVATIEALTGNPTIFEIGPAGARHVSLARPGAQYTLPLEIQTGADDSASFRLPDSNVAVAPNSVMRIAAPQQTESGLFQRVIQTVGSSLFSVDRQTVEHFQVETPYLVSVVKGTTFNVVVHDEGATVALHEGRLLVKSLDDTKSVILLPGDVAFANEQGELQRLQSFRKAATIVQLDNETRESTSGNMERDSVLDLTQNGQSIVDSALAGTIPEGLALNEDFGSLLDVANSIDVGAGPAASASVDLGEIDIDLGAAVGLVDLDPVVDVDLGATVAVLDLDPVVDIDLGAAIDLGLDPVTDVDLGTTVELGLDPVVDIDLGAAVGLVDLDPVVDVDLGATIAVVDLDPVVDIDLGATVDLGLDPVVDIDLGATVDAGLDPVVDVDLGASVAVVDLDPVVDVDLGATVDVDLDPVVDIDLGATVDVGSAAVVDAGLEVTTDLDIGSVGDVGDIGEIADVSGDLVEDLEVPVELIDIPDIGPLLF